MTEKNFKYNEFLSNLQCVCPPIHNLDSTNQTAYRWIFEDLNHFNNHHPPLKIEPTRIDEFSTCEKKCQGYALSLFNDAKKAEDKLSKLLKRKPLLAETLGNCIGKVEITKLNGLSDQPTKTGHFNLHEYEKTEIKFVIHKKLKID